MRSVDGYGMIDEREKDKCLFREDRHRMIKPKYYLVERTLLPEVFQRVIEANEAIASGKAATASEAARSPVCRAVRTTNIRTAFALS